MPHQRFYSLYGPGAFAAWLCTLGSVLISWTFNRQSKSRDTLGNDLIAALVLPSIAAIQSHYELRKARKGCWAAYGASHRRDNMCHPLVLSDCTLASEPCCRQRKAEEIDLYCMC